MLEQGDRGCEPGGQRVAVQIPGPGAGHDLRAARGEQIGGSGPVNEMRHLREVLYRANIGSPGLAHTQPSCEYEGVRRRQFAGLGRPASVGHERQQRSEAGDRRSGVSLSGELPGMKPLLVTVHQLGQRRLKHPLDLAERLPKARTGTTRAGRRGKLARPRA